MSSAAGKKTKNDGRVKVHCRLRPFSSDIEPRDSSEQKDSGVFLLTGAETSQESCIEVDGPKGLRFVKDGEEKAYAFDSFFPPEISQEVVYSRVAADIVQV